MRIIIRYTMNTVYIETSIVSYLRHRASSQVVMAARQLLTHQWWNHERANYDLVISQYVIDEASAGDATLAAERLQSLEGIPLLPLDPDIALIADEIHRTRREFSDKFHGDFAAMLDDARKRQDASGRPMWKPNSSNKPVQRNGVPSADF